MSMTAQELYNRLANEIRDGNGGKSVWVDPPTSSGEDCTLYLGKDEDSDELGELEFNG
jgi:hypothetical protein